MDYSVLSDIVLSDICSSHQLKTIPNILTHRQSRETWGIAIKITGNTIYTCNKKSIPSDRNHIVLLPKGSSYSWKSSGGECLIINFDAQLSHDELLCFKMKDSRHIIHLFHKIEQEQTLAHPFYKQKCLQYTYEIINELISSQREKYVPSDKQQRIQPVVDYLSIHYADSNLCNAYLSQMAGMSSAYFRKVFTEAYHCPPMEYVYRIRMRQAAEMLRSDYNSITAVAEAVGYHSVYHFSKMFKNYYGVSPSRLPLRKTPSNHGAVT